MFDENKLVHFTHKKHTKEATTFHFNRFIDETMEVCGEIEIIWDTHNGISYELMLIEKRNDLNNDLIYSFVSITDEEWFKENLDIITDFYKRSFEISSVFRGEI